MSNLPSFNPLVHTACLLQPDYTSPVIAWSGHLPFAFAIIDMCRPRLLVELGTHYGNSFCAFCQAVDHLKLDTRCHAVDTWAGDPQAGHYGEEVINTLKAYQDRKYGHFSKLIRSTFDEALSLYEDGCIDLLHIDGLHTYEAVKHDFETWRPKMSPQGVILFHDTNVFEKDFGVYKLWRELRRIYPGFEFMHSNGLGILAVGTNPPAALLPLLNSTPEESDAIRVFFAHQGQLWLDKHMSVLRAAESAKHIAQLNTSLSHVNSLNQQITATNCEQKHLLDRQADKIHRMQSSFSWKLTSPFRALRRTVFRNPPPRLMGYRFHIDSPTPSSFSQTGTTHIVAGWYADSEGKPARAIRVKIGKHIVPCTAISRPDVQKKFEGPIPISPDTGFRAAFKTGCGIKLINIQVMDASGSWITLARSLIRAVPLPYTPTIPKFTPESTAVQSQASAFWGGLDGLWQSCRSVKLNYTEETCALTWVIPDFNEGGGGHQTIFRMIKNLEDLGAPRQQVVIVGHYSKKDRFQAESEARKYFSATTARIYLHTDPIPRTEALIATGWQTAYFVKQQPENIRKLYFVQDFEPLFYAAGSNSMLAENTYRFGFEVITAGHWLKSILSRDYGSRAVSFGFSYDRRFYYPAQASQEHFEYDIFFYARPFTERRMFDLGVASIQLAIASTGRPLKVAFAGSNLSPDCTPFPFFNLGILSQEQLGIVYRKTRCALVLSATNASLMPYELMGCGCPVVTNQGQNNEWLFPGGYAGVVASTPEDIGGLIGKIITQPELRRSLTQQGLQIVAATDWTDGAREILKFIRQGELTA